MEIALPNSLFDTLIVGMSVSGYILEAPGLGLRKIVSLVCVAALVSASGPFFASLILLIIELTAKSSVGSFPAIIKKASCCSNSNCFLIF